MIFETEIGKQTLNICSQNLISRLALYNRQQDRNQPAHDVCIAVAGKRQDDAIAARFGRADQPDLARAATHFIRVDPGEWDRALEVLREEGMP